MGSPQLDLAAYALSTAERSLIGSFTYSPAEFAETAAWVGTVPDGIDVADRRPGRLGAGLRRASTTSPGDAARRARSWSSRRAATRRCGAGVSTHRIAHVRAFTVGAGGGADYHDQRADHWIDDHIATPMARYPEYRQSRRSFGINVLGTLVVEIEADDGTVGFAVTTGGEPGACIVEKHLARFLEGALVTDIEKIWDQMYSSTQYYGRKGLVLNAISGVDLALWDLLGRLRQEPVYHLLGGAVRDELTFYATGARPDLAKEMGFIGGKMPLHHGPAEGEEGLRKNIAELADMRETRRRRLLADVRLLDGARPRLRHPAGASRRTSTG